MGKPFTLIADHKSLATLLQSFEGIGSRPLRLARWSARLLRFRVIYRNSSQNIVGDALLRLLASEHKSSKPINNEVVILSVLSKQLAILPEQLSQETVADTVPKQVVEILPTRCPEKKNISKALQSYFHVRNELYLWDNQRTARGAWAVISESL